MYRIVVPKGLSSSPTRNFKHVRTSKDVAYMLKYDNPYNIIAFLKSAVNVKEIRCEFVEFSK